MPRTRSVPAEDPRLADYGRHLRDADLSAVTVRGYLHDLDLFLRWWQERRPQARLEKLTGQDVTAYRDHLIDERHARPATVNRRLESLRRFFRWARQQRIVKQAVEVTTRPVRRRQRRPAELKGEELRNLRMAVGACRPSVAPRNHALVELFLQTGLRLEEVAVLRGADVTVHERSGVVRVRRGKGRKEREVALNAPARRALRAYFDQRGEPEPHGPVFLNPRGDAMSVRTIQYTITELGRRAGITRLAVTPQLLRHTFAHLYRHKYPDRLEELKAILGHESVETTSLYTLPSDDAITETLERLSDSL